MKIGIAVTTRNRESIRMNMYHKMEGMRPENAILVYVDDASYGCYSWCNYQFEQHAGVSMAKNKCLEVLTDAGCDELFLFDDDCYPIDANWYQYYIDSPLKHACWTFERKVLDYSNGHYIEYEKPCGCMLYFNRSVIDIVGGWDMEFTGYGYEHCNISDRIFNNGLTPKRYVDIDCDKKLFELLPCESSFTSRDREQIPTNLKLYQQKFYSKEFKPYK